MSLERILTDYGEPLQYLVYFGLLATPDMHRVHHSALGPDTDSNYGVVVSRSARPASIVSRLAPHAPVPGRRLARLAEYA